MYQECGAVFHYDITHYLHHKKGMQHKSESRCKGKKEKEKQEGDTC